MNEEEFIVKTISLAIKRGVNYILSVVSVMFAIVLIAVYHEDLLYFLIGFLIFLSILFQVVIINLDKKLQKFAQGELNAHGS